MVKHIVLFLTLITVSGILHSEEIRYVNDELVVQLRTGPTFNHRNFRGLNSGARLVLLETSEDGKWARVRTRNDEEGWLPTQYLSPEPAARDVLKTVRQQLEKVKEENAALNNELAKVSDSEKDVRAQLTQASDRSESLSEELEHIKSVSANAVQLDQDNKRLLQDNQVLKNQVDVLATENQRLKDAKSNNEFMNGAYAVLIGVFITLLVPRLWPRKRDEWA